MYGVSVWIMCVTVGAFGGVGSGPTQLLSPRAVVSCVPSTTTAKMTTTTNPSTMTRRVVTSPQASAIVSGVVPGKCLHLVVSALLAVIVTEV